MRRTERRRPELTPGAICDGLSLPQQALKREPKAEQTHHEAAMETQESNWPILLLLFSIGLLLKGFRRERERASWLSLSLCLVISFYVMIFIYIHKSVNCERERETM